MGQAGSRVLNTLTREFRNFNVENRAHKVISREKPIPAPRYPADERELERIAEENPDLQLEYSKRNINLDDRLKKVFVTSHDPEHNIKSKSSIARPLPVRRITPSMPFFGFEEPDKVEAGKVTFKQAVTFITDHQASPENWSKEKISQHYNLDIEVVGNILEHFRPFKFNMPVEGDGLSQEKLQDETKQQLPA